MPEGNTIHRLALVHTRDLAGRAVRASSPQGRFSREAARLDGRRFLEAEAYGKHLFHRWHGGLVVHVHLGMAGSFSQFAGAPPAPRVSVRMRLSVPRVTFDLIGPPTCELIDEEARRAVVARLGPDPLRSDGDPEVAWENLRRRPKRTIGDALIDQRVVSGVGNIYRNEALFLLGIHPLRPAGRLSHADWIALWSTIRRLMRRGVRAGTRTVDRLETPHPLAASRRDPGDDDFYVYQQTVCRRCGGALRELSVSDRRMFVCPVCQPRSPRRPSETAAS
jgi:endonuclease-8